MKHARGRLRTQAELAARTDVLAQREADIAERERAIDEAAGPENANRAALDELEERLERLEVEANDGPPTGTFGESLRRLERKSGGTRSTG